MSGTDQILAARTRGLNLTTGETAAVAPPGQARTEGRQPSSAAFPMTADQLDVESGREEAVIPVSSSPHIATNTANLVLEGRLPSAPPSPTFYEITSLRFDTDGEAYAISRPVCLPAIPARLARARQADDQRNAPSDLEASWEDGGGEEDHHRDGECDCSCHNPFFSGPPGPRERDGFLDLRELFTDVILDCVAVAVMEEDGIGDELRGREKVTATLRAALEQVAVHTVAVNALRGDANLSGEDDGYDDPLLVPWSVVMWSTTWELVRHFGIPPEMYEDAVDAIVASHGLPRSPFVDWHRLGDVVTCSGDLVEDLPLLIAHEYRFWVAYYVQTEAPCAVCR